MSLAMPMSSRPDLSPELAGFILPIKIHSTAGQVENAHTLLNGTRRFKAAPAQCCTLISSESGKTRIVLDYGVVVAGIPIFQIKAVHPEGSVDHVRMRVRYTEAYSYIDREGGDGPFPFTAAGDTLRDNEYKISLPGPIEHFHLQGGQRWQVIELASPGSLTLTFVGFRPTTYNVEPSRMPGYFTCSDSQLNDIWATGARSVQINCQPSRHNTVNWHPSPLGMIIKSQRVSHYVWAGQWTDYIFMFEAKIVDGGLAFSVNSRNGFGPLFQAYAEDRHLKLDLSYGFYNQEQTTLWSTPLDSVTIPLDLATEAWHTWEVITIGTEHYQVKVNSKLVARFAKSYKDKKNTNGKPQTINPHEGSFGIGTGAEQVAIFRNAVVTSPEGDILYANSLQDASALSDFAVQTNILPVTYDGAKRDRAVWLGDNIVPALALYYSTGRPEFIEGSIEAILRRQQEAGNIPAFGLAGFPFMEYRPDEEVQPPFHFLAGSFTMYVVRVCYEHLMHTGDIAFIKTLYPKLQKLIQNIQQWIDKRNVLTMNGLWAMDSDYYNKPRSGATTKNNALYIIALRKLAEIALYLGDVDSQTLYLEASQKTAQATGDLLFNDKSGVYDASENDRDIISEDANAFALLAELPNSTERRSSILEKLRKLYSPGGCLSFDMECGYMETPVVSPIMNGWHAEAALQTPGHFNDALDIWRSCWGPMVDVHTDFYSGAHWEFSTPQGKPHMDHFCSLAHPFSSLPVYQLSKYALGLYPEQPGWKSFRMQPLWGFLVHLDFARGRVPTPFGTIHVSWVKTPGPAGDIYKVELTVPPTTEALVTFPSSPNGVVPAYQGTKTSSEIGVKFQGVQTVEIVVSYVKQ